MGQEFLEYIHITTVFPYFVEKALDTQYHPMLKNWKVLLWHAYHKSTLLVVSWPLFHFVLDPTQRLLAIGHIVNFNCLFIDL